MSPGYAWVATLCTAEDDVLILLTFANWNPLESVAQSVHDHSAPPTAYRPAEVSGVTGLVSFQCRRLGLVDRLYSRTVRPVCTKKSDELAARARTAAPACTTIRGAALPRTTCTVEPRAKYTAPFGASANACPKTLRAGPRRIRPVLCRPGAVARAGDPAAACADASGPTPAATTAAATGIAADTRPRRRTVMTDIVSSFRAAYRRSHVVIGTPTALSGRILQIDNGSGVANQALMASVNGSTAGAPACRISIAARVIVHPDSTRSSTSSTGPPTRPTASRSSS